MVERAIPDDDLRARFGIGTGSNFGSYVTRNWTVLTESEAMSMPPAN